MLCINKAARRQPLDIFLSAANFTDLSAVATRRQLDLPSTELSPLKPVQITNRNCKVETNKQTVETTGVNNEGTGIGDNSVKVRVIYVVVNEPAAQTSSYFQRNESMLTFDYLAAVSEALHLMYDRRLCWIVGHHLIYCSHFFLALRTGIVDTHLSLV
ncbi:jg6948 [Pararge aegeria aegeria]|uniref:Jg6948 protein n=1 Tax=Pararge aegeria aegeria TaxID=348720 RepID=A0A8S4S693_9NEOP|nr:jg6948 [Pararge aegeria aegeria]